MHNESLAHTRVDRFFGENESHLPKTRTLACHSEGPKSASVAFARLWKRLLIGARSSEGCQAARSPLRRRERLWVAQGAGAVGSTCVARARGARGQPLHPLRPVAEVKIERQRRPCRGCLKGSSEWVRHPHRAVGAVAAGSKSAYPGPAGGSGQCSRCSSGPKRVDDDGAGRASRCRGRAAPPAAVAVWSAAAPLYPPGG